MSNTYTNGATLPVTKLEQGGAYSHKHIQEMLSHLKIISVNSDSIYLIHLYFGMHCTLLPSSRRPLFLSWGTQSGGLWGNQRECPRVSRVGGRWPASVRSHRAWPTELHFWALRWVRWLCQVSQVSDIQSTPPTTTTIKKR